MLKKLIIAALIAIAAKAQDTYCEDMKELCIPPKPTEHDIEACTIREKACIQSGIWISACPNKANPIVDSNHHSHHHHHKNPKKEGSVKM